MISRWYYQNAHIALIVYDVTSQASLDCAEYWHKEVVSRASGLKRVTLVGSKRDVLDERAGGVSASSYATLHSLENECEIIYDHIQGLQPSRRYGANGI